MVKGCPGPRAARHRPSRAQLALGSRQHRKQQRLYGTSHYCQPLVIDERESTGRLKARSVHLADDNVVATTRREQANRVLGREPCICPVIRTGAYWPATLAAATVRRRSWSDEGWLWRKKDPLMPRAVTRVIVPLSSGGSTRCDGSSTAWWRRASCAPSTLERSRTIANLATRRGTAQRPRPEHP
jgi:hypothetical protein